MLTETLPVALLFFLQLPGFQCSAEREAAARVQSVHGASDNERITPLESNPQIDVAQCYQHCL